MLTLKLISEETERVIKGLEKKHFEDARKTIENVLIIDRHRRDAQQKLDKNKQQANLLAKDIGMLMKTGRKEQAEVVKAQVAELKTFDKKLWLFPPSNPTDVTQLHYGIKWSSGSDHLFWNEYYAYIHFDESNHMTEFEISTEVARDWNE